jgi:hypothetical protein
VVSGEEYDTLVIMKYFMPDWSILILIPGEYFADLSPDIVNVNVGESAEAKVQSSPADNQPVDSV